MPCPDYQIVYVCHEYPGIAPKIGGIGFCVRDEAHWFAAHGHAVSVVCLTDGGAAGSYSIDGIQVHTLPGFRIPKVRAAADRIRVAERVRRLLGDTPGIAVSQEYDGPLLTKPFPQPLLVQFQGAAVVNLSTTGQKPRRITRTLERRTVQLATAIQSCSQFTTDSTLALLGIAGKPVCVLPHPADTVTFAPDPPTVRHRDIFFAGKFVKLKGILALADAMRHVFRAAPDARLIVAGDPTAPATEAVRRDFWKRIPPEHHGSVVFAGWLSRNAVAGWMRSAGVVVVPSLVDAFPLVVLEACASGRPVVASRRGGIPEMVEHGVTGLLADPDEPESFGGAILTLLRNPDQADAMGRAGRSLMMREYAPDRLFTRLEHFHRGLLQDAGFSGE